MRAAPLIREEHAFKLAINLISRDLTPMPQKSIKESHHYPRQKAQNVGQLVPAVIERQQR